MSTIPFEQPMSVVRAIRETHNRVGVIPTDPGLRYVIPVPKGWGRVSELAARAGHGRPEIMGIFSPSTDLSGPRVVVSVERLAWEVDPLEWVRLGWERSGWSIGVARWLKTPQGRFEVGALRERDGTAEVRRTTGFVDNGRLIRVDVGTPLAQWSQWHDVLWPCGILTQLASPTRVTAIEATRGVRCGPIGVEVPRSWHAETAKPVATAFRAVVIATQGTQGSVTLCIDVSAPRRGLPTAEHRVARLRRGLYEQGVAVARHGTPFELGLVGSPRVEGAFSFGCSRGDERLELRTAHLGLDETQVDLAVLVASPKQCPIDWLRGCRALQLAADSLTTKHEEDDLDAA